MTEENMNLGEHKCNCFCHSEWFKKFLVTTVGSFLGVFFALSLFAALHKPPMMMPCPCHGRMMPPPMMHHHGFDRMDRGPRGDFHKKFMKDGKNFEPPVRVQVEK